MVETGKGAVGWKILTLMNTVADVIGGLGKIKDIPIPDVFKQQLPKWFGLTLDDERIFNGVLALLTAKQQNVITEFLQKKCKNYERNRFINIVAGMEVVPGKAKEKKTNQDKDGNVTSHEIASGYKGLDRRQKFLESFANIITNDFGGDLDKAYDYCIGGRMILKDPFSQQVLKEFSDSIGFVNQKIAEVTGAVVKNLSSIPDEAKSFRERSRAYRESKRGK